MSKIPEIHSQHLGMDSSISALDNLLPYAASTVRSEEKLLDIGSRLQFWI